MCRTVTRVWDVHSLLVLDCATCVAFARWVWHVSGMCAPDQGRMRQWFLCACVPSRHWEWHPQGLNSCPILPLGYRSQVTKMFPRDSGAYRGLSFESQCPPLRAAWTIHGCTGDPWPLSGFSHHDQGRQSAHLEGWTRMPGLPHRGAWRQGAVQWGIVPKARGVTSEVQGQPV